MRVLWLASWYPSKNDPLTGDFFQRHANIAAINHTIDVLHIKRDDQIQANIDISFSQKNNLSEKIILYKPFLHKIKFVSNFFSAIYWWRFNLKEINKYIQTHGKPDIIHVHGWIASLMPLYLKQYYKDEPLFSKSKVVTSIYDNEISGDLNPEIISKIKFDEVESETLNVLENPTYENLYKLSIMNSDGVVFASENIKKSYLDVAANSKIPVLKCGFKDGFEKEYMNFYNDKILN